MKLTIKEICENIWNLECKYDLLFKEIQGVKVWQLLRVKIYYDIARRLELFGEAHTNSNKIAFKLKALPSLFNSLFFQHPLSVNHKKILIYDHRRKRKVNGKYIDIYTHYLIETLNKEELIVLESPYLNKHFSNDSIYRKHTDLLNTLAYVGSKIYPVAFTEEEASFITNLENEIYNIFGTRFKLHKMFLKSIKQHKIKVFLYDKLLKRIRPVKIFTVVSYGNGSLIAAAKQNQIPVIEIQHGNISSYHLGYSFPNCSRELDYFPDYFYAFGDYWKDVVKLPIKEENVIPYGFPYFEKIKKDYDNILKKTNQILFISQGSIGKELANFAYKTALNLKDYNIVFKLHPGEYDRWKKEYVDLLLAKELGNFTIIDNDEVNLYEYLAESQYQVGVYSTAVYEGLAFRCKTLLVDLPGLEHLNDLLDQGFAIKINSVEQLKIALANDSFKDFNASYFFSGID